MLSRLLPVRAPLGRAARGLYHGKTVVFGNQISFSKRHTKRTWMPNVHTKTYHSELLNESFQMKVTTKAIRSIDKAGGLDNYLVFTQDALLGPNEDSLGVQLKRRVRSVIRESGGNFNKRDRTIVVPSTSPSDTNTNTTAAAESVEAPKVAST